MVFTGAYRVVTNDGMWVYTLPSNRKEEQHTNHHVVQPRIDAFPTRKAHWASSPGRGEIEEINQLPVNWCISLLALRKHAFERYILSSLIFSTSLLLSVFAYPRLSISITFLSSWADCRGSRLQWCQYHRPLASFCLFWALIPRILINLHYMSF